MTRRLFHPPRQPDLSRLTAKTPAAMATQVARQQRTHLGIGGYAIGCPFCRWSERRPCPSNTPGNNGFAVASRLRGALGAHLRGAHQVELGQLMEANNG